MRALFRAAILATLVLLPVSASAHLAGGADVTKDGYILDFGYDPAPPVAGAPATFALNLADAKTMTAVRADGIWVRIVKDGAAVFAGTFKPVDGNATFTAVLPDEGRYDVTARFTRNGKTVEGAYSLTAAPRAAVAAIASAPPAAAADDAPDARNAARVFAAVAVALGAYLYGTYRGMRSGER